MYRKDRKHPVTVTEYLSECKRTTEPWKMEHRMLRHKALIQAARYAFGFAGVYDEDEARNIIENEPAAPRLRVPSVSEVEGAVIEGKAIPGPTKPAEPKREGPAIDAPNDKDGNSPRYLWAWERIKAITGKAELEAFWLEQIAPDEKKWFPDDWKALVDDYEGRMLELEGNAA
jgi:hypothetical protein